MRITELAKIIKINEAGVRRLLRTGFLNFTKVGVTIEITEDDKLEAIKKISKILAFEYKEFERRTKKEQKKYLKEMKKINAQVNEETHEENIENTCIIDAPSPEAPKEPEPIQKTS